MTPTGATRKSKWGRLLLAVLVAAVLLVLLVGVYLNYSFQQMSRQEFMARLDHAIDTSTDWLVHNPDYQNNPPLLFMVGDMARMSNDPRLKTIIDNYLVGRHVRVPGVPVTWYYARMADPAAQVPILLAPDLPNLGWQDRWNSYAMAPARVEITPEDRANLFSPTKYSWGTRLHIQLLALDMYRSFNGPSPELEQTLNPITAGVAREANWDFRINDVFYQRTAFLLGAGRPDLVKSRWVDLILDHQRENGSWNYCWHGWCRGIFEFKSFEFNTGHPTVQAACRALSLIASGFCGQRRIAGRLVCAVSRAQTDELRPVQRDLPTEE
jgi:hypothetical protein